MDLPELGVWDSVAVFLVELLLGTIAATGLIGSMAIFIFNGPFFENFQIMLSRKDVPTAIYIFRIHNLIWWYINWNNFILPTAILWKEYDLVISL